MKFLTGDDTGILKWVHVEAQKIEKVGQQRRGDAVQKLSWGGPEGQPEDRFLAGYESGAIEVRSTASGEVLGTATVSPQVRCLARLGTGAVAISEDGSGSIVADWCGEALPAPSQSSKKKAKPQVQSEARRFSLSAPISDARLDPSGAGRVVFGGGENDVKIFDLERNEVTWRAKNMKENWLCLRIPTRVSQVQWATPAAPSRMPIISCSSDGKIRLYDAGMQRRPLFELEIGYKAGAGSGGYTGDVDTTGRPVKCSVIGSTGNNSWSLFVGNSVGVLREYDLRNLKDCTTAENCPGRKSHLKEAFRALPFKRGYKGIMGGIREIDLHPNGRALVAVGLGRFAYLFDTAKKRMTSKVYLKQKLCSVLFSGELPVEPEDGEGKQEEGKAPDPDAEDDDSDNAEDQVREGFSSDEEDGGAPADEAEGEEASADEGGEAEADGDGGEKAPTARRTKRKVTRAKSGGRKRCRAEG